MAVINQIELPDGSNYDIYGVNVQEISYDDYESLTPTQKNSDIAYCITDTPYEVDDSIYGEASGAIASFSDGSNNPLVKLEADINPIQDLHGYTKPWAGGAGKNILPVVEGGTRNSVTCTVYSDGHLKFTMSSPPTANAIFYSDYFTLKAGTYKLNGVPAGGLNNYVLYLDGVSGSANVGEEKTITVASDTTTRTVAQVYSGGSANNIEFYPMLRDASITDATFAPYSNICPISGWSSVEVTVAGKNKFDYSAVTDLSGMSNNNGVFTNTATDAKTMFAFAVQQFNGSSYVTQNMLDISTAGRYSVTFTVSQEITKLRIKHNGSTQDLRLDYPFTMQGTFTVSFTIISANPSIVGGLSFKDVMIESGSTETSYEPYNADTETISLGQTVYGGKLNVTTGELMGDRAMVDLGDLQWTILDTHGDITRFIPSSVPNIKQIATKTMNLLCTCFETNLTSDDYLDGSIYNFNSTIIVATSLYKTTSSIAEHVRGQTLVYDLATPLTITILPTQICSLLGNNNITADSGDVTLTYITSDFLYNELRMNDTIIASNGFAYHSIESESATMAGHANTATTSTKLASDAGSNLNPVYFDDGVPVASIGNSVPFITGTGTVAGTWLGSLEGLTAYYDGLLILYKPSVAGASTTTLNINGLGAKTCYVNNTTKLTTHYPANQPILLVYSANTNSGCFVAVDNYLDGNTTPNALYYWNNTYAKTKLLANTVIVGDSSGYSTAASGVQFDISYPILWTAAEVAQGSSNYASMFMQIYDRTLDTIKSGFTSTAKKVIYLVVTITGNVATVDSSIITDTLPSTDDGKVYISLGRLGAQSTGANYFNFQVTHPMFWYKGGKIVPYGATDAQTVNGHTVNSDVPANAVFTDTTYTFANGTNGFTVTPSGGTAQTVTVTPSISNNVTGSGTSGYLAKFNGANTITNGAQLGSDTTKFLRNDGEWAVPPGAGGGVTGVKGNAESTYRTGNVNLTPANLGLESKSAASGGTALSLVTTGEKYTWNHKSSTDENVKQVPTTINSDYEVLFSGSTGNTTKTESTRKTSTFTYNPYTNLMSIGNISATGNVSAAGDISATGSISASSNVSVGGNISITGTTTFTGNIVSPINSLSPITTIGSNVIVDDTTLDVSDVAPNVDVYGTYGVYLRDNAQVEIGKLRSYYMSDGEVGVEYETKRTVGGTVKYNNLNLGIDSSGNNVVSVSSPSAWRTALGLKDWVEVDHKGGTTPIAIPSGTTEICCVITVGNNTIAWTFTLPYVALSSTSWRYTNAYTSVSDGYIAVNVSTAQVSLNAVYSGKSNVTASSILYLYAR